MIKHGTVITDTQTFEADILSKAKNPPVGKNLTTSPNEIINATGKFILPGGVDHILISTADVWTVSSDDH